MLISWLTKRISRQVLEVAADFDERLEACEVLLQRLNESTKRSRLRSLRGTQFSNDELLAQAQVTAAAESVTPSSEPSHVRIAKLRRGG